MFLFKLKIINKHEGDLSLVGNTRINYIGRFIATLLISKFCDLNLYGKQFTKLNYIPFRIVLAHF
jgi:hypothetical protein